MMKGGLEMELYVQGGLSKDCGRNQTLNRGEVVAVKGFWWLEQLRVEDVERMMERFLSRDCETVEGDEEVERRVRSENGDGVKLVLLCKLQVLCGFGVVNEKTP